MGQNKRLKDYQTSGHSLAHGCLTLEVCKLIKSVGSVTPFKGDGQGSAHSTSNYCYGSPANPKRPNSDQSLEIKSKVRICLNIFPHCLYVGSSVAKMLFTVYSSVRTCSMCDSQARLEGVRVCVCFWLQKKTSADLSSFLCSKHWQSAVFLLVL